MRAAVRSIIVTILDFQSGPPEFESEHRDIHSIKLDLGTELILCVVLSVQPPVDKASGLLPEATLSFLVSDS